MVLNLLAVFRILVVESVGTYVTSSSRRKKSFDFGESRCGASVMVQFFIETEMQRVCAGEEGGSDELTP